MELSSNNLILLTKHYMGDLTRGLTVHSIGPISVAGGDRVDDRVWF